MKQTQIVDIVIGVAALAFLISRQLRARKVSSSGLRVVAVLAVLGLIEAVVAHGASDRDVGSATVLPYLAVSLGIQRVITQWRATHLEPLASV